MATILWVEDEADKIGGLIRPLIKAGHSVSIAKDKIEALQFIIERKFDLIILDIIIPEGLNNCTGNIVPYVGLELLKEIRIDKNIDTPVLVLSVVTDKDTINEIEKYNVSGVLRKGMLLPSKLKDEVDDILK